MNQKTIDKVSDIFYNTNYANKFAWPGFFKAQAYLFELKTDKFQKWFDSLKIPVTDNVWVNSVDTQKDKEIIYGYEDFKTLGYSECVARSIAIPAFIDKTPHIDGGVAQNPCLSQWADEPLPIFVSQLMMPFRIMPKGRLDKLFYSWEFSSFQKYNFIKEKYGSKIRTFFPFVTDVSSTDFGISKEAKQRMVRQAYQEVMQQFEFYGMEKQKEPTPVCVALSGGGIRSGSHIGFVQALIEFNYIPVKWSGTSGGAAFAVMFAGFGSEQG